MNSIIIELDRAVAKVDIVEEKESNTFLTYVSDKRIEEVVTNFGNNIITSYSVQDIDGKENIIFKDINNSSLTFVIQDENQDLGLNYISYLIDKYNERRKSFYEEEKEVRNINIALSTTSSYYEKINDEIINFVLHVSNDEVSVEDLDFARNVFEESFSTSPNIVKREKENIIIILIEKHLITIPKILFLKIDNIIKKRRQLKKLAFKKEGIKNENGRIS